RDFRTVDIDIAVTKSDSPDPIVRNGTLTYTLVATNLSSTVIANIVQITDYLDPNVTFVPGSISVTDTQGVIVTPANFTHTPGVGGSGGTLIGDLGYLVQSESVTITFDVTVNANAPIAGTQQG